MDIPPEATSDALWVKRVRNGETEAFERLYDAHVASLFRFLKQFSKDEGHIEELVQRAFIKAFENIGSFDERRRFSSWIFQIALNELRMDARRSKIVAFVEADEADYPQGVQNHEPFEWDFTMKSLLEQLDETKRMVFILYEVEGYSHSEIASMLKIEESTSRTILTRTKQWLKGQWDPQWRKS